MKNKNSMIQDYGLNKVNKKLNTVLEINNDTKKGINTRPPTHPSLIESSNKLTHLEITLASLIT